MRCLRLVLCVLMAALLAGCSDEPVTPTEYAAPSLSVAGNSGPSANGQAKLYFSGELQNVSFHAREMEDGSVSGSFESKSRAHTIEVHAKLDCLVVDGNEAILGGVFTQVRAGPDMPWKICVGDRLWFKVRDNGEGAGADPDEFTDWYWEGCGVATATQCGEYPFEEWPGWIPGFIPIEGGNVQVKG